MASNKFEQLMKAGAKKDSVSNPVFDKSVKKSANAKAIANDRTTGEASAVAKSLNYENIPLEQICSRFENLYIIDPEVMEGIMGSIEIEGLLQPISVINIEKYLTNVKNINPKEKEYLEERKANGFVYFIDIGHTRYRAYLSLATNTVIKSKEEQEKAYELLKDKTKLNDKYLTINAHVVSKIGYDSSNIHTRKLTNYEITMGIYNIIKENDLYEKLLKEYEATEKQKEAFVIRQYALRNYKKDMSEAGIRQNLNIDRRFDDRIKQQILDGKLKLKDAYKLLAVYEDISIHGEVDNLVQDIESSEFKVQRWQKKYTKQKEKEYSAAELKQFIYDIQKKKRTVDEVIGLIEDK